MTDTWTTKTGKVIKIKEMTNDHLMNTIRFVERSYAKAILLMLTTPGPSGEMAQDAFEREFNILDEEGPSGYHEAYDPLCEEADKRGLDTMKTRENRWFCLDEAVLRIATNKRKL